MSPAVISTKGQIVIPQEFRDRYHLKPQSRVLWVDQGGALFLVPVSKNPVSESRGLLRRSKLTQKALLKREGLKKINKRS